MWHSWKIKKGHRDDFFRDLKCQITRLVEVGNRPLIAVSWNFISPHFNLFRKFFNKLNYKFRTSDIVSICRKCSQKYRTNRILNVGQYWQITNPKFTTLFLCWIIITTQGKTASNEVVSELNGLEIGRSGSCTILKVDGHEYERWVNIQLKSWKWNVHICLSKACDLVVKRSRDRQKFYNGCFIWPEI